MYLELGGLYNQLYDIIDEPLTCMPPLRTRRRKVDIDMYVYSDGIGGYQDC